jgi:Acetyltransferase (GNAT) family/Ankyrin repeats (3 copies)/WW domain
VQTFGLAGGPALLSRRFSCDVGEVPVTAAMATFAPPAPWTLATSRSTGATYFFNTATRQSLWHDPALPAGWAWGKAAENAPKYFVNLFNGQVSHSWPVQASNSAPTTGVGTTLAGTKQPRPEGDCDDQDGYGPNKAKRFRKDADGEGDSAIGSSVASAPALLAAHKRVYPPAVMPSMHPDACSIGKPDDKPAVEIPSHISPLPSVAAADTTDTPFFNEAHRTVLRQICTHIKAELKKRAEWEAEHRDGDADEERALPIWDFGCGEGFSAAFLLSQLPSASAEVYCVDGWSKAFTQYYCDSLKEFGNEALADELSLRYSSSSSSTVSVTAQDIFLLSFWDDDRVTPVHYPDYQGLLTLRDLGIEPALVYLDCDLHASQLKTMLREITKRYPRAHIAGGGWNLSSDVRAAVLEVQREIGRPLHVEQGKAWTFSAELIKQSHNTSEDSSATLLAAAEVAGAAGSRAEAVESEALKLEEAKQEWLTKALNVITMSYDGGDLGALKAAIGEHGGRAANTSNVIAGAAAAIENHDAADDSDDPSCWINVGDSTKVHMTLLMHACKMGKTRVAEALIKDHGAKVNVQAEKSLFTALGLAAFEGHTDTVKMLLANGANPLLMNRYGETPLANAQTRRRSDIVALLKPLTETAMEQVKKNTPPSLPKVIALRNGRNLTLRRVTATDTKPVQSLYEACQLELVTDEVSKRVRQRWISYIFATDLADIDNRYSVIPRACFWVATVGQEDFRAMTAAAASSASSSSSSSAAAETGAGGGTGAGGEEAKSSSSTAFTKVTMPPPSKLTDSSGQVIIGCVGLKPYVTSGASSSSLSGNAVAESKTGELLRMAVHPEIRRMGIAAAIMNHLEEWARTAGYEKIHLTTQTTMVAAQALYTKAGYVLSGPAGGVQKSFHGDVVTLLDYQKEL